MNSRDPQMLAYETAIQQRARAQGGNAHIFYPPLMAVPHAGSSVGIHSPQWTGGQHPMGYGQGIAHDGAPQQPQQLQFTQNQQQPWGTNMPPHNGPPQTQHHPPPLWQQAPPPQGQLQSPMGYNNTITSPQPPPPHAMNHSPRVSPSPPYYQRQHQHRQQNWQQSGGPRRNTMNPGTPGSMPRPPLQTGRSNEAGWGHQQQQQQQQQLHPNDGGSSPPYRTPMKAQKPVRKGLIRDIQEVLKTTANDSDKATGGANPYASLDKTKKNEGSASPKANGCMSVNGSSPNASTAGGDGGSSASLFCEPCEKDFASESARQAHLLSHIPCSEPGCEFSASRKVVSAHHSATHGRFSGSGFQTISVEGRKFRVLLGTCPDEVEQWRAARRNRWPTGENVARKAEEEQKRRDLGGLGPDPGPAGRGRGMRGRGGSRGGRGRGRGDVNGRGDGGGGGGGGVNRTASLSAAVAGKQGEKEGATVAVGTKRGSETAGLVAEGTPSKVACVSAVGEPEGPEHASSPTVSAENGAELLMAPVAHVTAEPGVEDAHENTEEHRGEQLTEEDDSMTSNRPRKRPCTFYLKGNCSKGEHCTFSHDIQRQNCSYFMSGRCHRGKGCHFMHDKEARAQAKLANPGGDDSGARGGVANDKRRDTRPEASKPTLLRKLLAPQLHRENSIALQAVRFIVASNFFLDPAANNKSVQSTALPIENTVSTQSATPQLSS